MGGFKALWGVSGRAMSLRAVRRLSLVGTLGLLVFLGSAQAASAWHLTSVSPTSGCPGTEVKLTGNSFYGSTTTAEWRDPSSLIFTTVTTTATVNSSTSATAVVPVFLQTEGRGGGTVSLDHSNTVFFSFSDFQACVTGKGITGPTGPPAPADRPRRQTRSWPGCERGKGGCIATGPIGPEGKAGATGPAGATGATGPTGLEPASRRDRTRRSGRSRPGCERAKGGCTGPTGPIGPEGKAGATGPAGATGATGPTELGSGVNRPRRPDADRPDPRPGKPTRTVNEVKADVSVRLADRTRRQTRSHGTGRRDRCHRPPDLRVPKVETGLEGKTGATGPEAPGPTGPEVRADG